MWPELNVARAPQRVSGPPEVEVTGFHPAQGFEDFVKPMKPRGLVWAYGNSSSRMREDAIRHNKSFLEIGRFPAEHLACE